MLLTPGYLRCQRLIAVGFVHPLDIVVISAAGYAEKSAHGLYRVLFPFSIDRQIFHRYFHLLSASRRKSRSSSFCIFRRRISFSFSCSVGTYPFGGLLRRRGMIPASTCRIRRLYFDPSLYYIFVLKAKILRDFTICFPCCSSPAFLFLLVYGLAIQKAPWRSYFPTPGGLFVNVCFSWFCALSGAML